MFAVCCQPHGALAGSTFDVANLSYIIETASLEGLQDTSPIRQFPDILDSTAVFAHCYRNVLFTPTRTRQNKTRQNCLVLSCPCRQCELNWRQVKTVFSCFDPVSNFQVFKSPQYTRDWILSCPCRRCKIGNNNRYIWLFIISYGLLYIV